MITDFHSRNKNKAKANKDWVLGHFTAKRKECTLNDIEDISSKVSFLNPLRVLVDSLNIHLVLTRILAKERVLMEEVYLLGFPGVSDGKDSAFNAGDGLGHWVGKILWRREWQPTSVFLPGKSHWGSMGLQRVGHDWATNHHHIFWDPTWKFEKYPSSLLISLGDSFYIRVDLQSRRISKDGSSGHVCLWFLRVSGSQ